MPAVRIGLVANTRSGAADRAAAVGRRLRGAEAQVETIGLADFCNGPGSLDFERLASLSGRLRDEGVERIVAAGGDGTLGPAALLALRTGVPLAVVPSGTANSFARWLELPLDLEEAVALAARADAVTQPAEVADAAGRPFVNVAAAGLSVLAARRARAFKDRLGPLAYAVGAARAAATGRPLRVVVRADGTEAWRGSVWQVLVAATGAFGGDSATGGVDPADERLDVAIVPAGPRLALARRAFGMRRGQLVDQEEVEHLRGREIALEVAGDPPFNVDGEVLDLAEARFSVTGIVEVVVDPDRR